MERETNFSIIKFKKTGHFKRYKCSQEEITVQIQAFKGTTISQSEFEQEYW